MSSYIAAVIGLSIVITFVSLILGILTYVLNALGLMEIAKRRNVKLPWLAWIPYAANWQMGHIADEYNQRFENRKTNYRTLLLVLQIVGSILGIVIYAVSLSFAAFAISGPYPFYSGLLAGGITMLVVLVILLALAIVLLVFEYIVLYRIYKWCSQSYVAMLVCSIIFPFIIPFVLFAVRKGMNPQFAGPPAQPVMGQQAAPPEQDNSGYQGPHQI